MTEQTKKITQEELRKMMKERTATNKTKIKDANAKYNSLDQLTCALCCTVIKNEKLWSAHLLGRTHKENLTRSTAPAKLPPKKCPDSIRAPTDHETTNRAADKRFHVGDYDSSDESDDDKDERNEAVNIKQTSVSSSTPEKGDSKAEVTQSLPAGFFDDPKLDAKARNVPFKDKMEEEMEKFQKEIRQETEVAEAIIEEDYEERKRDREIAEIDEQLAYWQRLCSIIKNKKPNIELPPAKKRKIESDSDDDDNDDDADNIINRNFMKTKIL